MPRAWSSRVEFNLKSLCLQSFGRSFSIVIAAGLLASLEFGSGSAVAQEPAAAAAKPPAKIEDFAPPTEFVVAGGIKTHYQVTGDPAGRPIIFVHGFGSCTYTWRRNTPALAKAGYRVYALDIKGFGLTAKPRDDQYHIPAFSQHLLDFMDVMKIERPILAGNSMGGAVIVRLALLHPERVAALILVDAATPTFDIQSAPSRLLRDEKGVANEKAKPEAISALKGRFGVALAKTLITRKAIEMGLKGAYHDPKMVTAEAVDVYFRPFTIDGAVEAFLSMTSKAAKDDPNLPALKTLKLPVLIVWGRFDTVIPVTTADWFARELPQAKKVILEKSGHMPHEEEAEAFNTLVSEFAASLPNTLK